MKRQSNFCGLYRKYLKLISNNQLGTANSCNRDRTCARSYAKIIVVNLQQQMCKNKLRKLYQFRRACTADSQSTVPEAVGALWRGAKSAQRQVRIDAIGRIAVGRRFAGTAGTSDERLPRKCWRRGSESNRRTRLCRPLHNHSATPPS